MSVKSIEWRQHRAQLIAENRAMLDRADGEERELTADELTEYNKRDAEIDALHERIGREEKQEAREAELADVALSRAEETPEVPEHGDAFNRYLRSGYGALREAEARALQSDKDEAGGYLRPPVQWVQDLIQAVNNLVFVRQRATTYQVPNAQSLGVPSLDADPADPTWVGELSVGSEDSTMDFGKRELHPMALAQYIKVSRKLLRQVPNVDSLVRERLAYKTAVVQENAFLNGTGASQPLGVFTASDYGIGTGQDVSTGNTTTSITFDGLISAQMNLKPQYRQNAEWLFHTDAITQIRKLKDGEGQYIWQPGGQMGEPDMILGRPVMESQYAPNTFTTGLYVGIIADWRHYWIADALSFEVQRLDELYAANNQVGFVVRSECDGMPVLAEAFTRVTLA